MMRRQPTLIPLSDADVQDMRTFLEARKSGAIPVPGSITTGGSSAPTQRQQTVINDFALEAEIAQAAEQLTSGS